MTKVRERAVLVLVLHVVGSFRSLYWMNEIVYSLNEKGGMI